MLSNLIPFRIHKAQVNKHYDLSLSFLCTYMYMYMILLFTFYGIDLFIYLLTFPTCCHGKAQYKTSAIIIFF